MKASQRRVAEYFLRNGYLRAADPRLRRDRGQAYKKGYEVRFVLGSSGELKEVRALLRDAGIRPGRPFRKHSRLIQPVYGDAAQITILSWVGKLPPAKRSRR
jgi:hypothetical protein